MKKLAFLISLLLITVSFSVSAQSYFFYVQLKDKNGSPYSLDKPSDFLSERALLRRAHFNISLDSTDLPVNPYYIKAISSEDIHIHATTKWLNGLTIRLNDSSQIQSIKKLDFVDFVQFTGITDEINQTPSKRKRTKESNYDYGSAATQINQLNGQFLHQQGYKGENIHIAVIDAGFMNVDSNPVFNPLFSEDRLLSTKDFANPFSNIYREDAHGAHVLSTMAAEVDGSFVGTAPKASFHLLRTEAAVGEYLYEPDMWISAIEYADSAGVDLATTSLGYTTFDDAGMDYNYSDLDGKTIRASIAANLAYQKGIFLINAAGNDGGNSWRHIGVPADAEGVITVGSVNKDSLYSSFSSIGPSADGRVKPELVAIGQRSAIVNPYGNPTSGNGTSFAAPILAGASACFLQAAKKLVPTLSIKEIQELIFKSAHTYETPTPQLGYGIPNFEKAYSMLLSSSLIKTYHSPSTNKNTFKVVVSDTQNDILLNLSSEIPMQKREVGIYSTSGQLLLKTKVTNNRVILHNQSLQKGIYILHVH